MSNASNLYAEKIFSEHPDILWSLDEQSDYVSLITENARNILGWTVSIDGTELTTNFNDYVSEYTGEIKSPFSSSITNELVGQIPLSATGQIVCISDDIVNFSSLDTDLSNFAIGFYLYSLSPFIKSVEVGYEYYSTVNGQTIQKLKQYDYDIHEQWSFFSIVSDIPPENTTFRLVLKITYNEGSLTEDNYHFLINGFSVGQWSEEFNTTSLGLTTEIIPTDIAIPACDVVKAYAYSRNDNFGYYIIKNNKLLAKNSGIPMVYGASSVTTLYPDTEDSGPSLIIPGNGFLNNSGKYKEQTFETWIRIGSDAITPKRIFGPIASDDGLYVDGPFIKLKINNHIGSHFIGEWFRPMLLNIRVAQNNASVLINGDEVIKLNFITQDLIFPDKINQDSESQYFGKDQDWLGFYSYSDVSPIDIDCTAIYSYQVPPVLSKKRFAYGQAVEFPESINIAYSGESVYIDYPFAKYANNYSYPDLGNWNQGISDNILIENNNLSTPTYELPEVILQSGTLEQLYFDCSGIQNDSYKFFSLKPNTSWTSGGYILFNNLNFLGQDLKSIVASFRLDQSNIVNTKQQLLLLESKVNPDKNLSIYFQGSSIFYELNDGDNTSILAQKDNIDTSQFMFAAINFDLMQTYFGSEITSLLSNKNNLKLYIAGNPSFSNTFTGHIYNVGFSGTRNYTKISNKFNEDGTLLISQADINQLENTVFPHISNYTLIANNDLNVYSLDIAINSYWEDYIPLQHFAKYVLDSKGKPYYDLDFLQFNINYPAPSKYIQNVDQTTWTYAELKQQFASPIARTYSELDNALFTGFNNYEDLQNKSTLSYDYETTNSALRSYISFQYIATGANAPDGYFLYTDKPKQNGIVDPSETWQTTKYEVINNMIIYPPKDVDFSQLAIVTHLDFNLLSTRENKVIVKKLQYASQSLNSDQANPIGTRFGSDIYPYKKTGYYYNYKDKNPFTIYKGSSPYLYLTRYSGITVQGSIDPLVDRGLSITVNKNLQNNYKMIALQTALRYDKDFFPYSAIPIFEIEGRNTTLIFYIVATDTLGKRGRIYAINAKTGQLEDGISFYINGKVVRDPVITVKEWSFLGLAFPNAIDFSRAQGSISIHAPITFNTISYYLANALQETQKITNRPWLKVKGITPNELDWIFWDLNYMWRGVLVLATSSFYGIGPDTIYSNYTGTNKIIVSGESNLTFNNYEYNFYKDVTWQQTTNNAV